MCEFIKSLRSTVVVGAVGFVFLGAVAQSWGQVSLSEPTVRNAGRPSAEAYATLSVDADPAEAEVTLYYGVVDVGQTTVGWDGSIALGVMPTGEVAVAVSNLTAGLRYRFHAINSALPAEAWSAAQAIPAGMVGYWNFNEGSGDVALDRSKYMNDGYLFGSPAWSAGHTGNAEDFSLRFDENAAQYVRVTAAESLRIGANPNRTFTIGFWVYDRLSHYGEAFCFGTSGTRNLFWQTANNGVAASYFWSDSNGSFQRTFAGVGTTFMWRHLAIAYDGANLRFYRDGVLMNTQAATAPLTAWGDLFFGRSSTGIQPWDGFLDDFVIFDSVEDVASVMAGTHPSMTAPPPLRGQDDGIWARTDTGGLWSDTNNWQNGTMATGEVSTADFSQLDITEDKTVHLDFPLTIGTLVFGDTDTDSAAGWILDDNGVTENVLTLDGAAVIEINQLGEGKDVEISAAVTGTAGLVKRGAGTLKITGANTYVGQTYINGGRLGVGSLPVGGMIAFNNGGILDFAGGSGAVRLDTASSSDFAIDVTSGNLTVSRNGGSYNPIIKGGEGTLTVANGGGDDGGNLTLNAGTVVLSGATSIGAGFANFSNIDDVLPGATLRLGNGNGGQVYFAYAFNMSGGTFDVNGQNPPETQNGSVPAITGSGMVVNNSTTPGRAVFTITGNKTFNGTFADGAGTLAITLAAGAGSWTLPGTHTHSGATTIASGRLVAVAGGSFSNSAVNVTGGNLSLSIGDNKKQWSCASLGFSAGRALNFDFTAMPERAPAAAPLQVLGNVNFGANLAVNVAVPRNLRGSSYPLMRWTSRTGAEPPVGATVTGGEFDNPVELRVVAEDGGETLYMVVPVFDMTLLIVR